MSKFEPCSLRVKTWSKLHQIGLWCPWLAEPISFWCLLQACIQPFFQAVPVHAMPSLSLFANLHSSPHSNTCSDCITVILPTCCNHRSYCNLSRHTQANLVGSGTWALKPWQCMLHCVLTPWIITQASRQACMAHTEACSATGSLLWYLTS